MVCFTPVQGFKSAIPTAKGLYQFTKSAAIAQRVNGRLVTSTVRCHKCEGCRNDYSRQWAVKIMFESQMTHELLGQDCSFITLTYNDDHIPNFGNLEYSHFIKFMKRLRRAIAPHTIRYYMIGEYGDLNRRPHYHAIIFGYAFPDRVPHIERCGNILYRSAFLDSFWTTSERKRASRTSLGYASVGDVTFESAAYVARYSMKKVIGQQFDGFEEYISSEGEVLYRPKPTERYLTYHPETADPIVLNCERAFMSNGGGSSTAGGIGKSWFDHYYRDMYREFTHIKSNEPLVTDEYMMLGGKIVRPPPYFDKLLERVNPTLLESVKNSRQDHLSAHAFEFTPERMRARRECFLSKMKLYQRQIKDAYVK